MSLSELPSPKPSLQVADRRIESFNRHFDQKHLYLAYHGAFPLALTPELLYRLWDHFKYDVGGQLLDISWVAVADLLLSGLCNEVGYELYEMDSEVRTTLLRRLKADENFGQQRINELADFLLAYIRQQLSSEDPNIRDFAQVQRWTALSYIRSSEAAHELAVALSKAYPQNTSEVVRLASLVETLADPLSEFQPLLLYARGMKYIALGELEAAVAELSQVFGQEDQVEIADVPISLPEEIKRGSSTWRIGYGVAGAIVVIFIAGVSSRLPLIQSQPSPNRTSPSNPISAVPPSPTTSPIRPSTQASPQASTQPSTQPSIQASPQASTQPPAQPATQTSSQASPQPVTQTSPQASPQPVIQTSTQPQKTQTVLASTPKPLDKPVAVVIPSPSASTPSIPKPPDKPVAVATPSPSASTLSTPTLITEIPNRTGKRSKDCPRPPATVYPPGGLFSVDGMIYCRDSQVYQPFSTFRCCPAGQPRNNKESDAKGCFDWPDTSPEGNGNSCLPIKRDGYYNFLKKG